MTCDGSEEHSIALFNRIKSGDESAFAALLRDYNPQLSAYVRRHLPVDLAARLDVNDVLQEVYLEAFQRLDQFSSIDESSLGRWLHTIARRQMIDLIRHHRALKRGGGRNPLELRAASPYDEVISMLHDLVVYERTPSQSAMSHEHHLAMHLALEKLRPLYRQVIQLRYMESKPIGEIAARLDRGPGAIYMLCNRALKELRAKLNGKSNA